MNTTTFEVPVFDTESYGSYDTLLQLQKIIDHEKKILDRVLATPVHLILSHQLERIRTRFLGKNAPVQEWLKGLKNVPAIERKQAGALLNDAKQYIQKHLEPFLDQLKHQKEWDELCAQTLDVTLPTPPSPFGALHPISFVLNDILNAFRRLGFTVIDGPELEHDFYNFEALNVLKDHPARDMQDTFFIQSEWVLRTQTSNAQIHALKNRSLPLRVVCPGYVYRNEHDMTHVPAFRQLECLVVDKNIHMGHLKSMIHALLHAAFGRPMAIRFRSSYFPFTEPSAEVDVQCQQCLGKGCRSCKHTGWCELGGSGMVHRRVLENCGIDPTVYSGFAFGFGIDRIAKDKFGVSDLRSFFKGSLAFSQHFHLRS